MCLVTRRREAIRVQVSLRSGSNGIVGALTSSTGMRRVPTGLTGVIEALSDSAGVMGAPNGQGTGRKTQVEACHFPLLVPVKSVYPPV